MISKDILLDFEIDKFTHSLEEASTGCILFSEILPIEKEDLKLISKKSGWKFNWKTEFFNAEKQVYKIVLQNQPKIIQGLICLINEIDHNLYAVN